MHLVHPEHPEHPEHHEHPAVRCTRLAALGIAMLGIGVSASGDQDPSAPQVVHVVAERFLFTPSEITVEEGTPIELRITSDDTSHGFRLLGPGDIDVTIPKRNRGDVRVTIEALEPGEYIFECSRLCGAGHDFMRGTLRVKMARRDANSGRESRPEAIR